MAKSKDTQKEINKFLDQAREKFRVFGKELSVLAKRSEKELVKASKTGKIQVDIMGLNVQKEKLYYDVGKKMYSLHVKKNIEIDELKPFWKKMRDIESSSRKKKRELSAIRKEKK